MAVFVVVAVALDPVEFPSLAPLQNLAMILKPPFKTPSELLHEHGSTGDVQKNGV